MLIKQKEWLFLDLGSALLNEDQYLLQRDIILYRLLINEGLVIETQVYQQAIAAIKHNLAQSVARAVLAHFIPDPAIQARLHERYKEHLRPRQKAFRQLYPDALDVLQRLNQTIRLGIIADQERWVAQALTDRWGIASYFEVIALSQVVGFKKPDLRLYKLALSQAGVEPQAAIMLGDRPDKDIAPANRLGITIIRLRRGMDFKDSPPRNQAEVADYEITSLAELLEVRDFYG